MEVALDDLLVLVHFLLELDFTEEQLIVRVLFELAEYTGEHVPLKQLQDMPDVLTFNDMLLVLLIELTAQEFACFDFLIGVDVLENFVNFSEGPNVI